MQSETLTTSMCAYATPLCASVDTIQYIVVDMSGLIRLEQRLKLIGVILPKEEMIDSVLPIVTLYPKERRPKLDHSTSLMCE